MNSYSIVCLHFDVCLIVMDKFVKKFPKPQDEGIKWYLVGLERHKDLFFEGYLFDKCSFVNVLSLTVQSVSAELGPANLC